MALDTQVVDAEQLIVKHLDLWTSAQTAKSTAGRGSNNKIELTGIKKLRELIFELAVRGKLVPQDPNDEPARELLERLTEARDGLVKQGKLKSKAPITPLSNDDFPFLIPNSWAFVRVEDIGTTQTGTTPSQAKISSSDINIPFIKPGDITDHAVSYDGDYISAEVAYQYGRVAPAGSLLMVCIGTIGKCGLIDRECTFNQQINSLTPYLNICDFLLLAFKSESFQKNAWLSSSSTTISILNKGRWGRLIVPIPPHEEQIRIVSRVSSLMILCDQLEQQSYQSIDAHNQLVDTLLQTLVDSANADELDSNWQRLSEHFDTLFTTEYSIDALKQTILQLAVMGKLVKQDPTDEPASELLKRIAKEKEVLVKAGKIKKQKPLPPITDTEKPFEIPGGWEKCRLNDLIILISGQHLKPEEYLLNHEDGCVPYITGPAEFGDIHPTFDKFTFERRAIAQAGDVLVTCKGAGLGKLNIADCEIAISRQLMAVRAVLVSRKYLELVLDSLYQYFQSKGVGIAIPGISREDILEKEMLLPPLAEQNRIVDKCTLLMDICDGLACELISSKKIQAVLADVMVADVI